jgi:glycosyltransferase involved in cell wall biosynthesis
MRILHVLSSLDPASGGPVEALRGLATAQRREGLDVRVLASWRQGDSLDLANQLRSRGLSIQLTGPCWGPLAWHADLRSTVASEVVASDLVHIHGLWEEIHHRAASTAREWGKPYLIRPCGMLDPWSLAQRRWKKALYLAWRLRADLNHAAALHFTTTIEQTLTRPLRLRSPGIVEPNGIEEADLDRMPSRGLFRQRHGLADRPVALFLGRIHPKKGLDLLLPAFAAVASDALLVVAGPDADGYRGRLEAEVERLKLRGRVLFPGLLLGQEKWSALVDADLFVLPSRQENFGVAVIESLAAGTPVLISDQVNIHPEIRAAGVGGVVPLELALLSRELALWLGDPQIRQAAAERAVAFVRERYLWSAIARRWVGHYERLRAPSARYGNQFRG